MLKLVHFSVTDIVQIKGTMKPENSLGVKRLGRKDDRLPPSSAIPLLSMYIHVVHRNIFASFFYINES